MGSEVEEERDDRWWLGLRGHSVVSVDPHAFSVVVGFGGGSSLTLESVASVRTAPREPETPVVSLNDDGTVLMSDTLRSLVGQRVVSSVAFKTGELRLVFDSGALLNVPFGEQYEAWQVTGASGRMWVSLPGGGLASFPAASK